MNKKIIILLAIIISSCGDKKLSSTNKADGNKITTEDVLKVHENTNYSRLSDTRSEITYNKMSIEQRQTIISMAKINLGEIYSNRLTKIQDFGTQVDPLIQLKNFESNFMDSPIEEFHRELAKIFHSQRDYHVWYLAQGPASCYAAFLPFSVIHAKKNASKIVVVKSINTKGNALNIAPEINKLSVGDELISFNDNDLQTELNKLNIYNRGANPGAFLRGSTSLLTYRPQRHLVPLPEEDVINLKFKKHNGEIYDLSIPWLVNSDLNCLKNNKKEDGHKAFIAENTFIMDYEQLYKNPVVKRKKSNPFILADSKVKFNKGFIRHSEINQTKDPSISWWSFNNNGNLYGVIKLDSFNPSITSDESKQIVSNILSNEMANFDGVIFDLRNNGGGIIHYGESLVELVSNKTVDLLKFQFLNTPAMRHLVNNAWPNSEYVSAIQDAEKRNALMTDPIYLDGVTPEYLFTTGQVFFKPTAIFTNGNCYSTCDITAALYQDTGLGEIWSEDAQTGGGGANNWNFGELLNALPNDNLGPFKELPTSMDMGFAFRQTIRSGSHLGEIIEDVGVVADHVIEASVEDIITNGDSQFKKIADSLESKKSKYLSEVSFNKNYEDKSWEKFLNIQIDFKATDKIQVFNNRQLIYEKFVKFSQDTQTAVLPIDMEQFHKNTALLEIKGSLNSNPVWRKVTNVRKISKPIAIDSTDKFEIKLNSENSPLNIYNFVKNEIGGWHIEDDTLRIGNGNNDYTSLLNSTASLFLNIKNREKATLNFDLEYHTEKDYDFLSLIIKSKHNSTTIYLLSGDADTKKYQIDLSPYLNQEFEIQFSFKSDETITSKGVKIKNISVE